MILLTEEEVRMLPNTTFNGWYNPSPDVVARAQLKKVEEELQRQVGIYSRTADDGRVWLPIDEFRQSLLGEIDDCKA